MTPASREEATISTTRRKKEREIDTDRTNVRDWDRDKRNKKEHDSSREKEVEKGRRCGRDVEGKEMKTKLGKKKG